jgi:hypothetical protein
MKKILTLCLLTFIILANTIQTQAIYHGTPTNAHPFLYYIASIYPDGKLGTCGVNFTSPNTAITSAHCVQGAKELYVSKDGADIQRIQQAGIKAKSFTYSPRYNDRDYKFSPGLGDIAVVTFSDNVTLPDYAFVEPPTAGCGYYLVGYGKNESDIPLKRTGTDVCIEAITDDSIILSFGGKSHFCNGDSGSGIYKKGTNKVVGLVSAYLFPRGQTADCSQGTAYVATRVDSNLDYLKKHLPTSAYENQKGRSTQPNDYLEKKYPETKSPDGSFNYDNDIMVKIEELKKIFDEVYPEKDPSAPRNTVQPRSTSTPMDLDDKRDDDTRIERDDNDNINNNRDRNNNSSNTDDVNPLYTMVGAVVICLCCLSFIFIFVLIFFLLFRKK